MHSHITVAKMLPYTCLLPKGEMSFDRGNAAAAEPPQRR